MFLLKSIFIFIKNFWNKQFCVSVYEDDFQMFSKFYNFFLKYPHYFNVFFKKFKNINFNSKFLYLYLLYYVSKKKNIISSGEFLKFLKISLVFNKTPKIKTYYNLNTSYLVFFSGLLKNFISKKIDSSTLVTKLPEKLKRSTNYLKLLNFPQNIKSTFKKNLQIRYNSTSIVKYINDSTDYTIYFLRKNRLFNKGRYSRNRQNYRTGVYWCLYINIIALFGLYFFFYRFTFNFGYLWWLFYCLPASFIIPQVIKHRLYNLNVFYNSIISYFIFFYNCLQTIFIKK